MSEMNAFELFNELTHTLNSDDLAKVWGVKKEVQDIEQTITIDTVVSESSRPVNNRKVKKLLATGTQDDSLCDYELIRKIGQGGMGVVYLAEQPAMQREIVLKMILDGQAKDEETKNKFFKEAAITGKLDHPNIVHVYDLAETEENDLFYSMEQVKGDEWDKKISVLSLEENLEIFLRVCDAVAYAHNKGIIHRDLKPSNVMLGYFGEVFVMDWGLATELGKNSTIVQVDDGPLCGTPAFMAPEMTLKESGLVGTGSDVYLLGGILFYILTGKPPHHGETVQQCLYHAMLNQLVETDEASPLMTIAKKALATKPEDRYASVKALQEAIRHCQTQTLSLQIFDDAKNDFEQAKKDKSYRQFNRIGLFLEEALKVWPKNVAAKDFLNTVKFDYASCAVEQGDLELALEILDEQVPLHNELIQKIQTKKRLRERRNRHLLLGLAQIKVAVGVIITLAFIYLCHSLINLDRQKKGEVATLKNMFQMHNEKILKQNVSTAWEIIRAAWLHQRAIELGHFGQDNYLTPEEVMTNAQKLIVDILEPVYDGEAFLWIDYLDDSEQPPIFSHHFVGERGRRLPVVNNWFDKAQNQARRNEIRSLALKNEQGFFNYRLDDDDTMKKERRLYYRSFKPLGWVLCFSRVASEEEIRAFVDPGKIKSEFKASLSKNLILFVLVTILAVFFASYFNKRVKNTLE